MDQDQDNSLTDYISNWAQKGLGAVGSGLTTLAKNPGHTLQSMAGALPMEPFSTLAGAKSLADAIPMAPKSDPMAKPFAQEDYQSASFKPPYGNEQPPQVPVPPVDTATDDEEDDETRNGNPKVASSHPGFNQDELEKYLLKEKGDIDKYGADKQSSDFDSLRARQHSVGNQIGRGLAAAGDGLMQGVAQQGNPNFLEHLDQNQARQLTTQTEAGKEFHATNMADIKAKEGLDTQSNQNPLGQATAAAMLPILKQIYPGKTDEEYMQMARNPAVAESLLPEAMKGKLAEEQHLSTQAQRETTNEMRRESMEMRRDVNYKTGLEKDVAGLDKDANFVKAQGTVDKLGTAKELLEAGNVNNASAKQALQTALTFVATGGQRVNETEMKQLGGAHTVTNRVGQWIQGLDKGTLTPKDYADMKQVIGIYQNGAQQAMEQHITQKAAERAQREHISPEQARRELGHEPATPAMPGAGTQVPTISDQASYDALPVGSKYLGPDGTPHTKKR